MADVYRSPFGTAPFGTAPVDASGVIRGSVTTAISGVTLGNSSLTWTPTIPTPQMQAYYDITKYALSLATARGVIQLHPDGSVTMPEGGLAETAADWEAIGVAMARAHDQAVRQKAREMLDELRRELEVPDITVYDAITTILTRLGRAKGNTGE